MSTAIQEKNSQYFIDLENQYGAHNYHPLPVVLEKGEIIEQGTHEELTRLKGAYFELVKNQLELGN